MEITRTPNTNGTVDTCTLEAEYGFQCETHNFIRRGIAFQVVISDNEDGTNGFFEAIFPDHTVVSEYVSDHRGARFVKAEAREWVSSVAFPELDTRPRYGTPEWEANELALEARELEDEYLGR